MLQECGRKVTEQAEIEAAVEGLMPEARQLWKPIEHWSVRRVRTGVRALPPRTEAGAMPLAGKLESGSRLLVLDTAFQSCTFAMVFYDTLSLAL